jgi:uncharacterized protein YkwD
VSPRRALTLFATLTAVSMVAPASAASAPVGDCQAGAGWPAALPATAADVVARVNAHRSARGLGALAVSPTLTAAAEWKSRHMAQYGYMQHDDPAPPVQRSPFERMQACGYPERAFSGENVAAGHTSPATVMAAWLGSPGHRANIERPEYQAIGVGVARATGGKHYWTQDFGSVADAAAPPPPPAPSPGGSPLPPPAPAGTDPPPLTPAAVRIDGCRRLRHAVRCRLVVARAPVVVRARLRQHGAVVASGSARALQAGPLRVRMRERRAVRRGRATLRLRAGDAQVRRVVRLR